MSTTHPDPLVGKRIREYEILEVLGKGSVGTVYRARHVYLEEDRAIKLIQTDPATEKQFVDCFIHEARILSHVHNPHLVQLHDFGQLDEHTLFMVMELIRGESVHQRVRTRGRLPAREAVAIVREAAVGLQAAHDVGIVHCDVSPHNLVLAAAAQGAETTKVIDFGIARPLPEGASNGTSRYAVVGKMEYASPEQCGMLEEGETIDSRSDVYSLAVTLYTMVTGRLPFHATSPQGYIVKHATQAPPAPTTLVAPGELSVPLERVILKGLAKKRADRQQSMTELVGELDQIVFQETPPDRSAAGVAALAHAPQVGELFAKRYQIEAKLGEGGMGAVYRAVDRLLEVPVALKVISRRVTHDPKALERLKREVILAWKIAHPNVCRIHDIGESDGSHYISMELLAGQSLDEMLEAGGRLAPAQGLPIVKQVLQALAAAHRVGVVHRDLKPQNVIVAPDGHAWIVDFGVSYSAEMTRVTETGIVVGTPHYMAPEQISGQSVDHRVDLYATGVILFHMFTGRFPFEASTPVGVLLGHLDTPPPLPSSFVATIPRAVEGIIMRALAKRPEERYRDAAEMLSAIESLDRPPELSAPQPTIAAAADRPHEPEEPMTETLAPAPPDAEAQGQEPPTLEQRAGAEVTAARRQFVAGQAAEAIARLERFTPAHPLVLEALAELRAELEREREEDCRRAAEEARAREAIAAARGEFHAGHRVEAVAALAEFTPPHELVARALTELRSELAATDRKRLEEQRAAQAIERARGDFAAGHHTRAIAALEDFRPALAVADALAELRARLAGFEAQRRAQAHERLLVPAASVPTPPEPTGRQPAVSASGTAGLRLALVSLAATGLVAGLVATAVFLTVGRTPKPENPVPGTLGQPQAVASPTASAAPSPSTAAAGSPGTGPGAPAREATSLPPPALRSPAADAEVSDGMVRLEWERVTDAPAYRVTIADNPAFTRPRVDRVGIPTTWLEARDLPQGKLYWRVTAIAADGSEGAVSDARRFSLKPAGSGAPVATGMPTPATAAALPTATPAPGTLQVRVLPWAEVSIDGRVVGTTPFKPLTLPPGKYTVTLSHPDYRPLKKTVTVPAGSLVRLEVDLSFEAFPK